MLIRSHIAVQRLTSPPFGRLSPAAGLNSAFLLCGQAPDFSTFKLGTPSSKRASSGTHVIIVQDPLQSGTFADLFRNHCREPQSPSSQIEWHWPATSHLLTARGAVICGLSLDLVQMAKTGSVCLLVMRFHCTQPCELPFGHALSVVPRGCVSQPEHHRDIDVYPIPSGYRDTDVYISPQRGRV
jgi:hypothetical protein